MSREKDKIPRIDKPEKPIVWRDEVRKKINLAASFRSESLRLEGEVRLLNQLLDMGMLE